MSVPQRRIFRTSALRRYARASEKPILPKFISPPVVVCLWLLVCLMLAAGALVLMVRVPVYTSGTALVMFEESAALHAEGGNLPVIALLPAGALPRLREGQKLLLRPSGKGSRTLGARIVAVEGLSNTEELRRRFQLNSCEFQPGVERGVLVLAELAKGSHSGEWNMENARSSTGWRAEVEIGTRRAATLLPLVGRFLGD